MAEEVTAKTTQSIIDRCAAIDWRQPRHDPMRITAAYERWLATLGLNRRVRCVADPADVEAWQTRIDGVANVWASMAAGNPAGFSTIRMLLNPALDPANLRWSLPSMGASETAANWALAVTAHMTAAEAAWNAWTAAWTEVAAGKPAIALAIALLCPGLPWAPPPMIACAASDALSACSNRTVWAALADVLAYWEREAVEKRWLAVSCKSPARDEIIAALVAVSEPMIEACEAGAFAHTLLDREIVVLASPSIWTDGRRLHRADGPAIEWPQTKVYAWKGVLLSEQFIVERQRITPDVIRAATDQRLQHTLVDIYAHTHGHRRCMQDMGGIMMHEDRTGRLWCVNPDRRLLPPQPGDVKLVEVLNGSVEADGSRKTYWLNVPPETQTAQEAVAWTYGMTPEQYGGLVVRT